MCSYSTNLSDMEKYIQVPRQPHLRLEHLPTTPPHWVYIPEQPWNDSTTNFTTYDQNSTLQVG